MDAIGQRRARCGYAKQPGALTGLAGRGDPAGRLVLLLIGRIPGLGRLPGDIPIDRERWTLFVPLGTMLVLSVLLTIVLNLIARWRR